MQKVRCLVVWAGLSEFSWAPWGEESRGSMENMMFENKNQTNPYLPFCFLDLHLVKSLSTLKKPWSNSNNKQRSTSGVESWDIIPIPKIKLVHLHLTQNMAGAGRILDCQRGSVSKIWPNIYSETTVYLAKYLQWNHCLRTCSNKSFRGWIAGFNPFCQLIEIRALGYPGILATGSYSPTLTGINISNIDWWYMRARSKHARSKKIASATGIQTPIRLATMNTRASGSLEVCFGLSCLCCLVSGT